MTTDIQGLAEAANQEEAEVAIFCQALTFSVDRFFDADESSEVFHARQRQLWDAIEHAGRTGAVLEAWRGKHSKEAAIVHTGIYS